MSTQELMQLRSSVPLTAPADSGGVQEGNRLAREHESVAMRCKNSVSNKHSHLSIELRSIEVFVYCDAEQKIWEKGKMQPLKQCYLPK